MPAGELPGVQRQLPSRKWARTGSAPRFGTGKHLVPPGGSQRPACSRRTEIVATAPGRDCCTRPGDLDTVDRTPELLVDLGKRFHTPLADNRQHLDRIHRAHANRTVVLIDNDVARQQQTKVYFFLNRVVGEGRVTDAKNEIPGKFDAEFSFSFTAPAETTTARSAPDTGHAVQSSTQSSQSSCL